MAAQANSVTDKILTPAKDVADAAMERGAEKLEGARERVRGLYNKTRDRAAEFEGQMEDYVKDNPMRSVLIAVGVGAGLGLLFGVLFSRR